MDKGNSVEFSGDVLDQRNDLTAPDVEDKAFYPERPTNVSIKETNSKKAK